MGFGVDTRDVALTTVGVAVLQVPTAAWLTHTWGCPAFFITEPIVDDELGAVPSDCLPTQPEMKKLRQQCNLLKAVTAIQHTQ
jgi:hypothetical protein